MIREVARYAPLCDTCGWRGSPHPRREAAERELAQHPCGIHREEHSNNGGLRSSFLGGGYNRKCVCGAFYVSENRDTFVCPKEQWEKAWTWRKING